MKRKFWGRKNKMLSLFAVLATIMAFPLHGSYVEWLGGMVAITGMMGFGIQDDKRLEAKGIGQEAKQ